MGTPVPYPNPAQGPVQVSLFFRYGAGEVELQVFTAAFRKVRSVPVGRAGPGRMDVPFDLRDSQGAALANGSYYLVVRSSQGWAVGRLLVLH